MSNGGTRKRQTRVEKLLRDGEAAARKTNGRTRALKSCSKNATRTTRRSVSAFVPRMQATTRFRSDAISGAGSAAKNTAPGSVGTRSSGSLDRFGTRQKSSRRVVLSLFVSVLCISGCRAHFPLVALASTVHRDSRESTRERFAACSRVQRRQTLLGPRVRSLEARA